MKFLSQRNQGNIFNHTILILLSLSIILPLAVLFFNSIKPQSEFGMNPLGFPYEIRLMNYYDAFVKGNYARVFLNSFTLVTGTLLICIPLSGLAAFSLAILNPRGNTTIVVGLYLLVGLSIPAQLFILPLFIIWKFFYLKKKLHIRQTIHQPQFPGPRSSGAIQMILDLIIAESKLITD